MMVPNSPFGVHFDQCFGPESHLWDSSERPAELAGDRKHPKSESSQKHNVFVRFLKAPLVSQSGPGVCFWTPAPLTSKTYPSKRTGALEPSSYRAPHAGPLRGRRIREACGHCRRPRKKGGETQMIAARKTFAQCIQVWGFNFIFPEEERDAGEIEYRPSLRSARAKDVCNIINDATREGAGKHES